MFSSVGRVKYHNHYVTLEIDQGIVDFYYSLIPKAWYAQRQAYRAHITISRLGKEEPGRMNWKYMDGMKVKFVYNPYIYEQKPYFFLKAYSDGIADIRSKLCLPKYRYPFDSYHITVGNVK